MAICRAYRKGTLFLYFGLTEYKSPLAGFLRLIYDYLFKQTDTREEWEKDRWDIRILNKKYGIKYARSTVGFYLNFTDIQNAVYKEYFKKYIKMRLLGGKNFSWGTSVGYSQVITKFFNFISEIEPEWNDLNGLTREHIEKYLEFLNQYVKNSLKRVNSNSKSYIILNLTYVKVFLSDSQLYDYIIAPCKCQPKHVHFRLFKDVQNYSFSLSKWFLIRYDCPTMLTTVA